MTLVANVVEKRSDRGQFSSPRCCVQAFVRNFTILMLQPVAAQIRQISVNIRQGDIGNECKTNVADVDLVQRQTGQRGVSCLLQKTEKIPHIQVVFIHRALRMRLDGLMVAEKVQQQLRSIQTVIHKSAGKDDESIAVIAAVTERRIRTKRIEASFDRQMYRRRCRCMIRMAWNSVTTPFCLLSGVLPPLD